MNFDLQLLYVLHTVVCKSQNYLEPSKGETVLYCELKSLNVLLIVVFLVVPVTKLADKLYCHLKRHSNKGIV